MANQTIPNLPTATSLTGNEELWASQNGASVKLTVTQIVGFGGLGTTVTVPAGGTGVTSILNNALMVGQGTAPIAVVTPGTTGQFLTAQTGGPPQWSTFTPGASVTDISFGATGLTPNTPTGGSVVVGGTLAVASGGTGVNTFTGNAILVGNGTSGVTATATGAAGQILIGSASVPAWLGAGTSGQILQTNGAGSDPTWVNLPGTGVATISFGTTGLTPSSATGGVVTVAGTLATANGGTGLTTYTTGKAVYSSSSSVLVSGTLPTTGGGTGLATFTSGGALYATSTSVLATGTLPVASGGTGNTTATGTGQVVLDTAPTIASSILTSPTITGASINSLNGGAFGGLRNCIINGSMNIDQRNAGVSQTFTAGAALAYCTDRFYAYCTGANVTGQQLGQIGGGLSTSPSLNIYRFTGAASVTGVWLGQRILNVDSVHLIGTTATLSAVISSSTLSSITWTAYYANTANTFGTVASPTVTSIASGVFSISSSLTRYNAQISIPSAASTGIQIVFSVGAFTSGTLTITNIQLEPGGVMTPFERVSLAATTSQCQFFYQTISGQLFVTSTGSAFYGNALVNVALSPAMRINPTIAGLTLTGSSASWVGTGFNSTVLSKSSLIVSPSSNQTTIGAFASFTGNASAEL